eukprot:2168246-Pyramimonas_sp.AAC.1
MSGQRSTLGKSRRWPWDRGYIARVPPLRLIQHPLTTHYEMNLMGSDINLAPVVDGPRIDIEVAADARF